MASGVATGLGGIGLFLLGMIVLTDGLKALAGDALRKLLTRFTTNAWTGALTGASTTAVIQSSSATTVMAVGFVGAGLLTFSQALGVIFGANIGTTLTGWIVAIFGFKFKIDALAYPLILTGVLLHLFLGRRFSAAGLALAGFGLIFVGIAALQAGLSGLEGVLTPDSFPQDTWGGRLLLVLIGIAVTVITQSSSAGLAAALTALHAHTIAFPQAAAMVIGMNVGTTATAMIATIGGSSDARRTGIAHVLFNVTTGIVAFCLLTPYELATDRLTGGLERANPEIALVLFHTLFNVIGALIFLPFVKYFGSFILWLVPERPIRFTERLDRTLYKDPAVAIESVRFTLKQLTAAVLETLLAELAGQRETRLRDTLEEAQQGLERTRQFLEPIDTSNAHASQYPRYVASIHTVDHLQRLIDRSLQIDRIQTVSQAAVTHAWIRQLETSLRDLISSAQTDSGEFREDEMQAFWEALEADSEATRKSLIDEAARLHLSPERTLQQLDAVRWLRRVVYHLWRIAHHLRRAQLDQPAAESDMIPPHLEQQTTD